MSKHTPGPWEWWSESTGRPKNYDLCRLQSATRRVAGGYGGNGEQALGKTPEDIANARLIAAAPDLLAALYNMLEDGDKTDREQALAAIKKATQ